ncbi:hypothetical protein CR513_60657, partial [Mucuna pruriens]
MFYNLENDTSTMLRVPRDARRGSHDSNYDISIFSWGNVSIAHSSICLVRLRTYGTKKIERLHEHFLY